MTYTPFAIANKGKVRPLAVAMEHAPPAPARRADVQGARRRLGRRRVPRHRRAEGDAAGSAARLSDMFAALNADPEMKELAAKSGFELVNVGVDGMDAFMRTRTRIYTDVGKRMGLGGKK
jgi:hypothetical protein